jgi:hypothetical protein
LIVTPAYAGVQLSVPDDAEINSWIPAFAGMTARATTILTLVITSSFDRHPAF